MRKIAPIFFLCLYFLSYTEMHELLSFPALIKHYHEHRIDNSSIDLFDFIALHYSADEHRHPTGSHDELPFSEDHCVHALTGNPIYFSEVQLKEFANVPGELSFATTYTHEIVTSQLHYSIWQPPKV